MDLTQIRDSEKQFLKSLPEDIKSYFENVIYNSESEDLITISFPDESFAL